MNLFFLNLPAHYSLVNEDGVVLSAFGKRVEEIDFINVEVLMGVSLLRFLWRIGSLPYWAVVLKEETGCNCITGVKFEVFLLRKERIVCVGIGVMLCAHWRRLQLGNYKRPSRPGAHSAFGAQCMFVLAIDAFRERKPTVLFN